MRPRISLAPAGFALLWWLGICGPGLRAGGEPVRALERAPHDPAAFTQGLLIDGGVWLESTGRYGESELREVDRATGRVLRSVKLPDHLFGEGLALWRGKLYQLTWRAGVCRVWDRQTFRLERSFRYEGEGWGLASDGERLYMSDGSARIAVRDPESFRVLRTVTVTAEGREVRGLNELEWIDGELWANVFQTPRIVRIDPRSGEVKGEVSLARLPLPGDRWRGQDVWNGIARDPETGAVWVTGKYWRALYRIPLPSPNEN